MAFPRRQQVVSFLAGVSVAVALLWPAGATAASFVAALDRDAVAPGEPFVYEVTLTVADEQVESYRGPDFRGLQVLSKPAGPNRSTQVQMGGGQTMVQNGYTWHYELALPAGSKAGVTIGAAHARVGGRDLKSNAVAVRVGASGRPPSPAGGVRGGGGLFPRGMFDDAPPEAVSSSAGAAFIRVVPDKTRAFVGEQVTVTWYLYRTEQENFQPVVQPRADGFWSEEIPSTNPQGRLVFTEQVEGGRRYQVATLHQKALFPLAPGKHTVTPMEAQVGQIDFFGRPVRTRRLKSDPVTIEAIALPREGQPPGFNAGNVGQYTLEATVDRAIVTVGDAITLILSAKGHGNPRNLQLPATAPALGPGWKVYEPKQTVTVEPGEVTNGAKSVEWLLRPERPGKTTIPPFELVTFDPATKRYVQARTMPIELVVSGDAPAAGGGAVAAPTLQPAGVDNVLAAAIRPIRTKTRPSSEVGVALLRGSWFKALLLAPPLAFAGLTLAGRVRRRLTADGPGTRRRRLRSLVRRRLRAAEVHRAAGRVTAFYVEIDRVLRDVLAERLRTPVAGLRLDELGDLLRARGLSDADTRRVLAILEACDEARFAPGSEANASEMLNKAGEVIDLVENAPLEETRRA